jgi:hypothetical protein
MNSTAYKTYTIKVSGINWDLYDEESDALLEAEDLPSNGIFEIEVETYIDPYEKWNEEGFATGYELFCNEVVEALTEEYGFCIDSIDDIEVLNEETGIGKQI